jgi:hypothetical protein
VKPRPRSVRPVELLGHAQHSGGAVDRRLAERSGALQQVRGHQGGQERDILIRRGHRAVQQAGESGFELQQPLDILVCPEPVEDLVLGGEDHLNVAVGPVVTDQPLGQPPQPGRPQP